MSSNDIDIQSFKERARQFRKEILETITEAGSGQRAPRRVSILCRDINKPLLLQNEA